jgi:predicted DNA-binding transcriptional regulator YafY
VYVVKPACGPLWRGAFQIKTIHEAGNDCMVADVSGSPRRGRPLDDVVSEVCQQLAKHPDGLNKAELVARIGRTSGPSVQRALTTLRDQHGAPIEYDHASCRWVLRDPSFRLPMHAPEPDDVRAVLIAAALLEPIADEALRERLRSLAEQLDDRVRQRHPSKATNARSTVEGRATHGTRFEPRHLALLLDANRRHPVRIVYDKPWENERVVHTVEPWGICVFDGAIYFRGFVRESDQPRTFRLAQVHHLLARPNDPLLAPIPLPHQVWEQQAPAFGIDEDRPDTAVVRLRGGIARWVHRTIWHPEQHDRWIDEPHLLERTVPYRSCRELARRILSILDGVESIDPPELRTQVESMIAHYQRHHLPDLPAAPLSRTTPETPKKKAHT